MKIVVTGGCGFIGSHFVEYVTEQGHEVIVIDNLSVGKKENLDNASKDKITICVEDILNYEKTKKLCSNADAIVHFAALTGVLQSLDDPIQFTNVNVLGTLNLLEICRELGIKKFVLASTGAVYGNQQPPFTEDMVLNPISPYAASKIAAENYCRVYTETFNISCSILRFTNVFGPRKSFGPYANVIPKFVHSILKNESITIFGDGTQERDFIYVKDIAKGCFLAVKNDVPGTFNIATGINTSINQLIDILENVLDKKIIKNYTSPRDGEVKFAFSSIENSKKLLSFSPSFSLKDGLEQFIEYEKKQI